MNLVHLFPVTISIEQNEKHSNVQDQLIENCLTIKNKVGVGGDNWDATTYNTCSTYNILKDDNFSNVNRWVINKVKEYATALGFNNDIKDMDAWFNIYQKYDYQETHDHEGNDISAIYYVKCPENSGKLFFLSHEAKGVKDTFKEDNPLTWKKYYFDPEPGRLVIFKSNLMHGVLQNKSDDFKISFAYNFKY